MDLKFPICGPLVREWKPHWNTGVRDVGCLPFTFAKNVDFSLLRCQPFLENNNICLSSIFISFSFLPLCGRGRQDKMVNETGWMFSYLVVLSPRRKEMGVSSSECGLASLRLPLPSEAEAIDPLHPFKFVCVSTRRPLQEGGLHILWARLIRHFSSSHIPAVQGYPFVIRPIVAWQKINTPSKMYGDAGKNMKGSEHLTLGLCKQYRFEKKKSPRRVFIIRQVYSWLVGGHERLGDINYSWIHSHLSLINSY